MELYLEMETERGPLMSSEYSFMSSGQPKQGAFSEGMCGSGEDKGRSRDENVQ